MNEPPPTYTHTHINAFNLTAEEHSGLTSSDQPSNPQANYKPHYVLPVLFPHHINSAMWSDRLRTDVEWHSRTKTSPVSVHNFTLFYQSFLLQFDLGIGGVAGLAFV